MNEHLEGYSKEILELLASKDIKIYDEVLIEWKGLKLRGIILPKPVYGDPSILIVKLDNGYNVGLDIKSVMRITKLGSAERSREFKRMKISPSKELPLVSIIGTGGTISSRVDYKTGAVYPSFKLEDLYTFLPEVFDIAFLEVEELLKIFSEDMSPKLWTLIAEKVAKKLGEGAKGVVIAHGTDTMGYTSAALSFALQNLPGPVVLVGAQRSSDRPSSDTALNLLAAVATAAYAPFGETVVAMHGSISDDYVLIHRGTKVRKMHTSRRDAFQSINTIPLAAFKENKIFLFTSEYRRRRRLEDLKLVNGFDEKVALIKFYPGMDPAIIDFLVDKDYHGIVIEASGLGHVRQELIPSIERAVEEEIPVVITSQCIWGRVNLNVYRRGVELIKAGVIPAEDMLPETAFVKLSWILAQTRDLKSVRKMFLTNIAFEISCRRCPEHYINLFTGIPIEKHAIEVIKLPLSEKS